MIHETCMSTVPSVLNGIYVLECDGCCHHSADIDLVWEGGETNSASVLLLIAREEGFCTGNLKRALKCQNKGGKKMENKYRLFSTCCFTFPAAISHGARGQQDPSWIPGLFPAGLVSRACLRALQIQSQPCACREREGP